MDVSGEGVGAPNEDMSFFTFNRLSGSAARTGKLMIAGRSPLLTPNYVQTTSRGAIPHLTPDNIPAGTAAAYLALEDFIEKQHNETPPIYALPNHIPPSASALQQFTALPKRLPLILGARRIPPVPCPAHNTDGSLSINCSFGFRQLEVMDYNIAARGLKPDIILSLPDLVWTERVSSKRLAKMVTRTEYWLAGMTKFLAGEAGQGAPKVFAPFLPLSIEAQNQYVEAIARNSLVSGLTLYDMEAAGELELLPETLRDLPIFSTAEAITPHEVLSMINAGIDLFSLPFLTQASDEGFMFAFAFGEDLPKDSSTMPMAINIWEKIGTPSATPLRETTTGCPCSTCIRHSRTYIHHLLVAKEMLAWTLIAKHNIFVLSRFFESVRSSIERGTFEADAEAFNKIYPNSWPSSIEVEAQEPDMDDYTEALADSRTRGGKSKTESRGPRNRGYQTALKLGERSSPLSLPNDGSISNGKPRPRLNGKSWKALSGLTRVGKSKEADSMELD